MTDIMLRATAVGAEWVMWLLAFLSVVSITLIFERVLYFRSRKVNIDRLSEELRDALRAGDVERAKGVVRDSRSIECVVVTAGLSAVPRGLHAVAETMHSVKARERLRLEAYLPVLGTLGNNAPFIGLLGTVIGIIRASMDMAEAQAAKQAAASAVMSGIFEALVATAVGLFVALPAVMAFNYFQRQVKSSLLRVDVLAHLLISYIKPKAEGIVAAPKSAVATPKTDVAVATPPHHPQGA